MEWTTLIATALGAAIGIVSTFIADRARWQRDTSERDREVLRASFALYVEALAQTYDDITHVSREVDRPVDDRVEDMRNVIGRHGVYAKQHQLELTAPAPVVRLALAAAHELAVYRDTVASGFTRETPECTAARRAYREARFSLIDAMRASLERR